MYGQQGIFKPKELSRGALSIRTSLNGPYQDEVLEGGECIRYDYSPRNGENAGVKLLAEEMTPLIYLVQVKPKPSPEYMVVSPVFVLGWNDAARTFDVSYQPARTAWFEADAVQEPTQVERRYGIQVYKARLHQAHFRKTVLSAYRNRCSVCELQVRPLLDGAHIVPDVDPLGLPVIQNGLAMCALHHRALDRKILRIDPDYKIAIDEERISSRDQSAQTALLAHQGRFIVLPKQEAQWPDPNRLRRAASL